MKVDTHPTYFPEAKVTCACGRSFTVGSTQEKLEVEICSNCHPFFTGNEKILDAAGRVEKFKKRAASKTTTKKSK
jgi:large subunit ribosomal protein L31